MEDGSETGDRLDSGESWVGDAGYINIQGFPLLARKLDQFMFYTPKILVIMPSRSSLLLGLLGSTAVAAAEETVLGAYILARHGDRTPKSNPPAELTELGYSQTYMTGSYYRSRYLSENSTLQIWGISPDVIVPAQVAASAPNDEVLQKSATAFFQGLYPPVGGDVASATLRNGEKVEAPMDGYQLVYVEQAEHGKDSENTMWLQGTSDCHNAKVSSNSYFTSESFEEMLESTEEFYESLVPMLENTFPPEDISFRNAYMVFDALNVANIHNSSFPSDELLTEETFAQLQYLANTYEFNLAWNESEPIRAIAGSTLATDILTALTSFVDSQGKKGSKLNVQFGAYANFMAFFGLAQLPKANVDFTGIPDYASSMAFELVTESEDEFPAAKDISVRFLFHNGTIEGSDAESKPTAFPLFGQSETVLPWSEFVLGMKEIGVPTDQAEWCEMCGSTSGECAAIDGDAVTASTENGISRPVAGVIGALVTLAVVLGVQALVLLAGGFRLVRKSKVVPQMQFEKQMSVSTASV